MNKGFLALLSLPLAVAAACASGNSTDEATATSSGGSGPGGGEPSSTSAGGEGGAGGAGGSGGDATTTTSTGPACTQDPCKLTEPQCGCPADEMCSVSANGRYCTPEGDVAWDQPCGADGQCAPGHLCISIDPPDGKSCAKFCELDSDCESPGGICLRTLGDGNGGVLPDVTLCTESCDPVTNTGCQVAGSGCQVAQEPAGGMDRIYSYCAAGGVATQGQPCPIGDECAPTYGCFDVGGNKTCLRWCSTPGLVGPCQQPALCQALNAPGGGPLAIGEVNYGVCQ
jgi:hypothetical protein